MTDKMQLLTKEQRDAMIKYFGENSLIFVGKRKGFGIMWEEVKNFLNENTEDEPKCSKCGATCQFTYMDICLECEWTYPQEKK